MSSTLLVIDMSVTPYNEIITFVAGAAVLLGSKLLVVVDDVAAAGTSIDTATLLTGQTNIVRSSTAGGDGVRLPMIIQGVITVINEWTQDIIAYPPGSAHINELAPQQGVIVSPNGKVDFSTAAAALKWVAR